jgi:exosortase A
VSKDGYLRLNMSKRWLFLMLIWAVACGILVAAYWPTWSEVFALWFNAEAYAHGPLVPAISVWLVWRVRAELGRVTDQPWLLAAVGVLAMMGMWVAGEVLQVAAVRHFAVVLMLIALTMCVIGKAASKFLIFPLAFLLFAVPFGDFLIDPMMEYTADFTVWALRLTGVPVYRDARMLLIPSGSWAVVEACSGTRYLVASVMLGALFAYLFYRTWKKRALFVLASILVPIVANWLRAYMIVMLGHLSQNRLAVGADHLVYGWVFFGVFIFIMFSVGARWREDDALPTMAGIDAGLHNTASTRWIMPAAAVLLATLPPLLISRSDAAVNTSSPAPLLATSAWSVAPMSAWKPEFKGDRARLLETVNGPNGTVVSVFRAHFTQQKRANRMIMYGNSFVPEAMAGVASVEPTMITRTIGGRTLNMVELRYLEGLKTRIVRGGFEIGDAWTGTPYLAKLLLAKKQITLQGDSSRALAWSAVGDDAATARARLDAFESAFGAQLLANPLQ